MDLKEILDKLDNVTFFETYGLRVIKRNQRKNWECECPFCGDPKHFSFNPEKGLWRCFKCEEKGNAVSYYARLKGCNNGQAIKAIKEFMGIKDDWNPENKKNKINNATSLEVPFDVDLPISTINDQYKHPYHRLVELSYLTNEHRQELKNKRGFNDETIDTFMFRSGGEYITNVVEQLKQEYTLEDLIETGIIRDTNGTYLIEKQLTDDRILIPYLDENKQVYHLRPHKLGFKGIPVEPYCKFLLKDRPSRVVLTEGEFKANALWQWGIPGLAIPGISSFGSNNFDKLVDLLRFYEVKEVVVIFDSETKDNPAYPNFKEKIEDRYDTQYWSYMMAYKLNKEGFRTSVGWLPPEWRDEGKIDFDGALAKGKTKADIEKVIGRAKSYKEFLASLDEDGQRVVKRKIAKHFTKLNIKREFNKYVTTVYPGKGEPYDKVISNFVINIVANFYAGDTIVRNVELVNEYGEKSDIIPMEPGAMAGVNEFKKFILSKGNYIFEGTATDLVNIWKYEFLNNTGELIYMPEQIGWIDKHNLWLFGNMAIKDGKVYKPDNDGIIWVNGKGFKPQSLSIGANGAATEDAIPSLYEKEVDIKEIAYKLKQSIGGYEAYMGIGWVVATIFSKDIFAKYKCMPILFPHGKRESGKSTFMRWLMNFFGIETEGISIGKTTTQNYVARALAYWSSLGTWFDEYRNETGVIEKDGLFRSAYNRQLSGKGTATAFRAKGFAVHSSIAISGEELPKDNGLFTRCIPLQISSYKRDRTWYEWINKNSEYFSGFVYHLIVNYDQYRQKILNNIAELKQVLVERGITDRTAENWAICAASFESTVLEDDEFIQWVERSCQEIKQTGEQEHMLNQFWDDINYLIAEGELSERHIRVENNFLYIWFPGVYETWALHYKKKTGREPFDKSSILKYLQEEPYYLKLDTKRMGKSSRKVHVINIETATDTINEIVGSLNIFINNT